MNEQIELARRYVEQTGTSLFLTGKAGTGKTTFLHEIDAHCPKRHVVVAPTGVAAVNASGVTIHSFFQLPFDPYLPDVKELVTEYQMPERHKLGKNKLTIMRTLELLIIDEISMVRADLLDAIDMTLRRVRRSSRPFGGVQLLMIGDVHQLPPVVTEKERPHMERVYPSPFFFHSKALQRLPYVTIELTQVYRQQDEAFVGLLNRVRNNSIDAQTLEALNARVERVERDGPPPTAHCPQPTNPPITLTTHNHQADAINRAHMERLTGECRTFEARVEGNYPESAFPVDRQLEVKVGERVMFVRNDSSGARRYYNGKLATVTGFLQDEGKEYVETIDDDGEVIAVGQERWENIKYDLDGKDHGIRQVVDGVFSQYPLRAAWAVTIHKAQGLTFDRVEVNAAEAFAFGQVYVALSRCRTLEGLTLTAPLTPSVTFSDVDVQQFCDSRPTLEAVREGVQLAESQYYYEQLADLFGMGALSADMERLTSLFAKLKRTYPQEYSRLLELQTSVSDLASVSDRFMQQLANMPQPQHADRIAKGAAYFNRQLTAATAALTVLLEVEVDNKETARQLDDLRGELTERLELKRAAFTAVEEKGFDVRAVQQAKADCLAGNGKKEEKPRRRGREGKKAVEEETVDEDLVRLLRRWRFKKASDDAVAPYLILQQKALLAIASQMPSDYEELASLPGVGPKTVKKYGKELLDIVADYKENSM